MRRAMRWILPFACLALAGCATVGGRQSLRDERAQVGTASFYAHRFDGRTTASGAVYDEHRLTAAHRTLPFGTRVRVTNLENDRRVVVTINDRGPSHHGRVIDVSWRAARELGILEAGTVRVRLEVLAD